MHALQGRITQNLAQAQKVKVPDAHKWKIPPEPMPGGASGARSCRYVDDPRVKIRSI
jgi:hypothetical protein